LISSLFIGMNSNIHHVLIIGSVWPEPASSGAGLRILQFIQLFRQQQWLVTFASTAATTEHMADLDSLSVRCVPILVNDSSFDVFIGKLQPDIVLFDRFSMEEQFGWRVETCCPQALRILETIDLHCLRHARHLQHKRQQQSESTVIQDVPTADLYNAIAYREIASIYRSDISILTSGYEMTLLQERFSMATEIIHLCPFMFTAQQIHTSTPDFQQRQHFMTIGNFRHAPNWDAVLWLKHSIWPLIRAQLPQAEMHIYGAYTPAKAMALHHPASGFHVLGRADNVDAVMQKSRICLAPLRFGAGIKTKLADAMRNGLPNITTSIGAEGMGVEGMSKAHPWAGTVANDARSLADAAVALYQQQSTWQQAQSHGFNILRSQFDSQRNGQALIQKIKQVLADLEQHRRHNFHGSMLRQHQHRSTEFMSRWIEAKNASKKKPKLPTN